MKERKSTRVGSRRIGRNSSSKDERSSSRKDGRRIQTGIIHIQAGFNNTIITVTDVQGQVFSWYSAGCPRLNDDDKRRFKGTQKRATFAAQTAVEYKRRFKGTQRGTPFAAQTAAEVVIRKMVDQGKKRAKVLIKGPGRGRDAVLRAIRRSDIQISVVRDVTPLPHNGCRPPKVRRL
ncbi:hypothetical protein MKW94_021287 [Papaver nudicaule]|uniref:30S ribosomal protein S11, chloroplastic n=1 Tax=Papaver nudicaule TaxID=74823 RepID=A0AA41VG66_PAPNU|nr:hypothetical protein [Papaver nudicaule]